MHWLTTAEGHIAILASLAANLTVTVAGLRSLARRLDGHVNGGDHRD